MHTGSFNRETLYDAAGYLRQQARHFCVISTSRSSQKNRLSKRNTGKGNGLKKGTGLTAATTDKRTNRAAHVQYQWFLIHHITEC